MIAQGVEDAGLQLLTRDPGMVRARPLVLHRRAAELTSIDNGIAAPALGAFDEAGEEVARAARCGKAVASILDIALADRGLARLHLGPKFIVDDAQLRDLLDDPLLFRVWARDTLARIRILEKALAVPDEPAYVKLVVEHAVGALHIAE
ncbi:hypothetical protein AQ1_01834 [alpha proteobacterium Q-1]|nr:hypothetical protein AQ1_01834 [alpha proteobacterium Q-1]